MNLILMQLWITTLQQPVFWVTTKKRDSKLRVQLFASVAVDRKTSVAVSTIKAADIELKLGTQKFPEILKSTPGVYATKSGGGYGDGRINLFGFSSENVSVLINGIPVNIMENGRLYWSN